MPLFDAIVRLFAVGAAGSTAICTAVTESDNIKSNAQKKDGGSTTRASPSPVKKGGFLSKAVSAVSSVAKRVSSSVKKYFVPTFSVSSTRTWSAPKKWQSVPKTTGQPKSAKSTGFRWSRPKWFGSKPASSSTKAAPPKSQPLSAVVRTWGRKVFGSRGGTKTLSNSKSKPSGGSGWSWNRSIFSGGASVRKYSSSLSARKKSQGGKSTSSGGFGWGRSLFGSKGSTIPATKGGSSTPKAVSTSGRFGWSRINYGSNSAPSTPKVSSKKGKKGKKGSSAVVQTRDVSNSVTRFRESGSWGRKWRVATTSTSITPTSESPQGFWTKRTWGKPVVDDGDKKHWGYLPPTDPKPNKEGNKLKAPNIDVEVASYTRESNVFNTSIDGSRKYGVVDVTGTAGVKGGVSAGVSAAVSREGVTAGINGSAGVTASASAGASYGIADVSATGSLFGGAQGGANVRLATDGVHLSGDVFAGAKAQGSVAADVGGIGVKATGEAWAGIGASAGADIGYHDGQFTIGGEVGAGLGVGGQIGTSITVDVPKVVNTVETYGGNVIDGVQAAGGAIISGAQIAEGAIIDGGQTVVNATENVMSDVGGAIEDAGGKAKKWLGI